MHRFIWIGNDCVNLDCIARFTVHDDGQRVAVILHGIEAKDEKRSVEGEEAQSLLAPIELMSIGKSPQEGSSPCVELAPPRASVGGPADS